MGIDKIVEETAKKIIREIRYINRKVLGITDYGIIRDQIQYMLEELKKEENKNG